MTATREVGTMREFFRSGYTATGFLLFGVLLAQFIWGGWAAPFFVMFGIAR
jgi:hypothetical protein